ncbi:methyltransferase domain-containing protein [Candidatus Methylopumilus planktonicus]|uniref:methyltransferase domain-containing protein n=1 Tax=Candidatus Methylopumilus planktonicus TaxID=1581557 RepID=UPI003BEF2FC6
MTLSESQVEEHAQVLSEKVFQIKTKWPQFELLLDDIRTISKNLKCGSNVIAMERTLLYGGNSLIAPFFSEHNFMSFDCSPSSADDRGAYNANMIEDARFIKIPYTKRVDFTLTGIASESLDLILIPNLIHHVKNQSALFEEVSRLLRIGGYVYIFEPLVRELHQIPDDYLRYTPFGLSEILKNFGFGEIKTSTTGGPFSVISYAWIQALEYFPEDLRVKMSEWFYSEEYDKLILFDNMYKQNLVRQHTSFPSAFSILAKRQ